MATRFRLNGEMVSAAADGDTPLLYILRNDFGLNARRIERFAEELQTQLDAK